MCGSTGRRSSAFVRERHAPIDARGRPALQIGAGDLWVTEYVLTCDGRPSYTVSIMEFLDGKVARETQYFGDPFEPGPSRAQWVERMP